MLLLIQYLNTVGNNQIMVYYTGVRFTFRDVKLERLFAKGDGKETLPQGVYNRFLYTIAIIQAAVDIRDLYHFKGLRLEKLRGDRDGQYSVRLNQQFRLCFEIIQDAEGNLLYILEIVDYH